MAEVDPPGLVGDERIRPSLQREPVRPLGRDDPANAVLGLEHHHLNRSAQKRTPLADPVSRRQPRQAPTDHNDAIRLASHRGTLDQWPNLLHRQGIIDPPSLTRPAPTNRMCPKPDSRQRSYRNGEVVNCKKPSNATLYEEAIACIHGITCTAQVQPNSNKGTSRWRVGASEPRSGSPARARPFLPSFPFLSGQARGRPASGSEAGDQPTKAGSRTLNSLPSPTPPLATSRLPPFISTRVFARNRPIPRPPREC